MSDTNKKETLGNQNQSDDRGIKIDFKPSGDKVDPFVVKKSSEQIRIEANNTYNDNDGTDINAANLGVFGDDATAGDSFAPTQTITPATEAEKNMNTSEIQMLSAIEAKKEKDDSTVDKRHKNTKIDFEKFERTKQSKSTGNGLGVKFDI
jgi:hypothetical protein